MSCDSAYRIIIFPRHRGRRRVESKRLAFLTTAQDGGQHISYASISVPIKKVLSGQYVWMRFRRENPASAGNFKLSKKKATDVMNVLRNVIKYDRMSIQLLTTCSYSHRWHVLPHKMIFVMGFAEVAEKFRPVRDTTAASTGACVS